MSIQPTSTQLAQANRVNAAIRAIALNHKALSADALGEAGLHVGQEWILEALAEHSPRSHADLAAWMGCEPPTVTSTVTKLEAAGLVVRHRRENDARVVDVAITDAGRAALAKVGDAWIALAEDSVGGTLDDEAAHDLVVTLEALAARLRGRRDERCRRRR